MTVSSVVWFGNLDSIISIFMKILRCFKGDQVLVSGGDVFRCWLSVFNQFSFKNKKAPGTKLQKARIGYLGMENYRQFLESKP